jgi:hypothetical protein
MSQNGLDGQLLAKAAIAKGNSRYEAGNIF